MTFPTNPPRMTITNLYSGETFRAQYNPEKLQEKLQATYAKLTVPGMSHQITQFTNTNNEQFDIELFMVANSVRNYEMMQTGRRFIKSLLVPVRGAESVVTGAPPRVLFVWPRTLAVQGVVTSANFSHEMFKDNGQTRVMRVDLSIEEIRDVRVTSEDIRNDRDARYGDPRLEPLSTTSERLRSENPYLRMMR